MDKTTPHGKDSSRSTRGVVLPDSFWSTRRGRRISKEQALYYGYGGTGILGLDAGVANDQATRLRPLADFYGQGLKEWHDDVYQEWAKDVWRALVMPPLPEIAEKVGRWRRTWRRIKDRERRAHDRVTQGLVGRSRGLLGPMGTRS